MRARIRSCLPVALDAESRKTILRVLRNQTVFLI
jgi:hypothetical protein